MTEADLLKLKYKKLATEATIFALYNIPNICNRYMDRFNKFYSILMKHAVKKEKDPKKCVKNVKKLESSPEFIDLLDNCLVPKLKHIDKIFKNYPKNLKKLIALSKKMILISEKKLKKIEKDTEKQIYASIILVSINNLKEKLIGLTAENERFKSFLKDNKKELADLKKNDVRAYITFYMIRYQLGCFVLP